MGICNVREVERYMLDEKIEELRNKLEYELEQGILSEGKVLEISQSLDVLINKYYNAFKSD